MIFNVLAYSNNLWRFDLNNGTWSHMFGDKIGYSHADYTVPYPGSSYKPTMAIDSTDIYIYVFGGYGFTDNSRGFRILVY